MHLLDTLLHCQPHQQPHGKKARANELVTCTLSALPCFEAFRVSQSTWQTRIGIILDRLESEEAMRKFLSGDGTAEWGDTWRRQAEQYRDEVLSFEHTRAEISEGAREKAQGERAAGCALREAAVVAGANAGNQLSRRKPSQGGSRDRGALNAAATKSAGDARRGRKRSATARDALAAEGADAPNGTAGGDADVTAGGTAGGSDGAMDDARDPLLPFLDAEDDGGTDALTAAPTRPRAGSRRGSRSGGSGRSTPVDSGIGGEIAAIVEASQRNMAGQREAEAEERRHRMEEAEKDREVKREEMKMQRERENRQQDMMADHMKMLQQMQQQQLAAQQQMFQTIMDKVLDKR